MSLILTTPPLKPADRLAVTLFLATALHAVTIMGVSFRYEDPFKRDNPPISMEVTLVHSHTEEAPEEADYLAQVSQVGGGNTTERVRPSSPFPNPTARNSEGDSPETRPAQSPQQVRMEERPVLATETEQPRKTVQKESTPQRPVPESMSAEMLIDRANEIARLSAEIREQAESYARQPRTKTISASTREYKYAAYEEAWRMKVERIGNLNYPDEARKRNLSGSLILEVALLPDGEIKGIRVIRSSGHKILDDAAERIVRLAAPFAPFPESIRHEVDVLQIIRTWQFQDRAVIR